MAELENKTKVKLERLLDMSGGYVLDFTNATFGDFVETSVGINIYGPEYEGSKASRLRQLWQRENNGVAVKLSTELLEYAEMIRQMNDQEQTEGERKLEESCISELSALSGESGISESDLAFLKKDFGKLDITHIPVPLTFQDVTTQRVDEIERCLKAGSPLAVIFLCGSTLEGLLFAVAEKNVVQFNTASTAPKGQDGKPKKFGDWTLNNLITTANELDIISRDVLKHGHALRDFRNYIHPRQQVRENFTPRMETAEIAYKVLQAAIADLSK